MKIKKEDYESQEAKELLAKYEQQLAEDKETLLAENLLGRIPEHRQEYLFKLLSMKYATKGSTNG